MADVRFEPFADYADGYKVMRDGELIGRVRKHFPTWERRTKGRRYVNARGTCKRPVWDAEDAKGEAVGYRHYTRGAAVAALIEAAESARR